MEHIVFNNIVKLCLWDISIVPRIISRYLSESSVKRHYCVRYGSVIVFYHIQVE